MSKSLLESLKDSHNKFLGQVGKMEVYLSNKVEMVEFSIFFQESDGFVLEWDGHNAPLDKCLSLIKEKGILSIADYKSIRI